MYVLIIRQSLNNGANTYIDIYYGNNYITWYLVEAPGTVCVGPEGISNWVPVLYVHGARNS